MNGLQKNWIKLRNYIEEKYILTEVWNSYNICFNYCKGSVLDVGCGKGYGNELFKLFKKQQISSYTGVDFKEIFLNEFKQSIKTYPLRFKKNVHLINYDDKNFPVNKKYDTVLSLTLMGHIDDETLFFERIKKVMKKDSLFIMNEHCEKMKLIGRLFLLFSNFLNVLFKTSYTVEEYSFDHNRYVFLSSIRDKLEEAGFNIILSKEVKCGWYIISTLNPIA